MKRKWILFIGLLFLLNHGQMLFSFGAEKEPSVPGVSMDEFDFSGIEEFVREKQDGQGPGFGEIMELLMAGEFDRLWNRALEALKKELFSEIASGGRFMGQILAL